MPRWVLLMLIGLMLGTTIAALWLSVRAERATLDRLVEARRALDRVEREIRVRAATKGAELNGRGWPMTIDPAWFGDDPPVNPLVGVDRPWVEIASSSERDLMDPSIRQSVSRAHAGFWYNPALGIIRARVGPAATDERALAMYNQLNDRNVDTLFAGGDPAAVAAPMLPPARPSPGPNKSPLTQQSEKP